MAFFSVPHISKNALIRSAALATLSDAETFSVTVNEVNVAPVLNEIPNQQANSGATVTFAATASDADLPANTLTFSLGAGAPAGAAIDSVTGRFTWVAATHRENITYPVSIIVTDNGNPILSSPLRTVSILVIGADDFTAWRRSKFGNDVDHPAKEATVWGDLADPDHDGTWSPEMKSWLYSGLEYVQVAAEGDHYLREVRMPVNRQRQLFTRLELLR